jgi:hypothetical protein
MSLLFADLGLNEAEAQALIDLASIDMPRVTSLVGSYAIDEVGRTQTRLRELAKKNEISVVEADRLSMVRRLSEVSPASFARRKFKAGMEEGYFTTHESFGYIHRTQFSSNGATFVGSPSLSTSGVSMKLGRASFKVSESSRQEPQLSDSRQLLTFDLASEQFASLLRNAHSSSPCYLTRVHGESTDQPPRMLTSINIAKTARDEAMTIGAPLVAACDALQAYLSGDHKISKKDDYAELVRLGTAVQDAMDAIVEPMRDLLMRTAGLMAESSSKQLIAEIEAPLKALGMDSSELYLRLR